MQSCAKGLQPAPLLSGFQFSLVSHCRPCGAAIADHRWRVFPSASDLVLKGHPDASLMRQRGRRRHDHEPICGSAPCIMCCGGTVFCHRCCSARCAPARTRARPTVRPFRKFRRGRCRKRRSDTASRSFPIFRPNHGVPPPTPNVRGANASSIKFSRFAAAAEWFAPRPSHASRHERGGITTTRDCIPECCEVPQERSFLAPVEVRWRCCQRPRSRGNHHEVWQTERAEFSRVACRGRQPRDGTIKSEPESVPRRPVP